jgi:hypothetical protein
MPEVDEGNPILVKHMLQTFDDIAVQVRHAQQVRGRARSGYYRAAILLTSALVEAMLHDFIKNRLKGDPSLIKKVKAFNKSKGVTTLVELPKQTLGTSKELWICEVDREKMDKMYGFKSMNDYALELGIINKRLYSSLEFVRKKRNEIHLQTIDSSGRNFNRQILNRVSDTLNKILVSYDF